MAARDFQKERVYASEENLRSVLDLATKTGSRTYDFHGSKLTLPEEYRFGTKENVQDYLDKVYAKYLPGYPVPSVRVHNGRTRGAYFENVISIPTKTGWAQRGVLRESYILHEVAHNLTPGDRHGPQFCGAYLWLLNWVVGGEIALLQMSFLSDHDVKFVPWSPLTQG